MDRTELLNRFYTLPDADRALLNAALKPCTFRKGHMLAEPGQIQKELYFVNSGVQMSYFESASQTHVVAFTYAPYICALPDAFALQTPSSCYLTCLTESQMDALTYADLQILFDRSQHIERLFRRMTEFVLAGVVQRHIELQSLSIEERYLAFCRRSPHLLQMLAHKHIASYLGIDPSNFSKLYNRIRI